MCSFSECEEVDDEYIGDTGLDDINDGKHYWLKCMFKNPTFCLVCGKIVSVLGDVPLDEENNVPLSVTTYQKEMCLNSSFRRSNTGHLLIARDTDAKSA